MAINRASSGALVSRVANKTRALSSFPSSLDAMNVVNNRRNKTTNSLQQHHKTRAPKETGHRIISADKSYSHRRTMVTITQTKSSDVPPLFSSQVVDDVSESSPSESDSPTYIANEETNLIVTESCLKQVERLLKQRRAKAEKPEDFDDGYFLRVFVDAGGCSGFQYQFEVDNDLDEDDDIVVVLTEIQDENDKTVTRPRVVVDEASMAFLEGSTIDYVIEMIKSAFVVSDNPQSESACGCGSSFAMKNFEKFGAKD